MDPVFSLQRELHSHFSYLTAVYNNYKKNNANIMEKSHSAKAVIVL